MSWYEQVIAEQTKYPNFDYKWIAIRQLKNIRE